MDALTDSMKELCAWLEHGKIVPAAVTGYPFAEAARAHKDLESGKTIGKLILLPD
jgi:NADPH:quinone reductase-like Zn-dependent oxidoreductase